MIYQKQRKIAAIVLTSLALLSLSGCFNFGGGNAPATKKTADTNSKTYDTAEFTITVPKDWEVIEKTQFTSDVPAETMVVFRNNVRNETFTANVNIVRNNLRTPLSTLDYAKEVINRQSAGLPNYKESKRDPIKISISGKDEDSFFTTFEARKATGEQLVRYVQTYGIKGSAAYIVTGSFSPQENENTAKIIEDAVKSFSIK
jgi:hypothetical protein